MRATSSSTRESRRSMLSWRSRAGPRGWEEHRRSLPASLPRRWSWTSLAGWRSEATYCPRSSRPWHRTLPRAEMPKSSRRIGSGCWKRGLQLAAITQAPRNPAPNRMDGGFLAALAEFLPRERLLTDDARLDAYRHDQALLVEAGAPIGAALPTSAGEVSQILSLASRYAVPVVPRGAGTGLSGGANATDGALVLALTKMDTILEIDVDNLVAVVQPGVINAAVGRAAAGHGLWYAADPASFEISSIGGNVATNAGGLNCLKYGVTRQSVLGLEVVLADGTTIRTGGRTLKQAAGYDLTGLFVGSEGTLGVITEVTLRLRPAPQPPATVVAFFNSLEEAGEAVLAVARSGVQPSVLELLDRTTIAAVESWKQLGLNTEAAAMLLAQ